MLGGSNRKPNETWLSKGTHFYKILMKSLLLDNDIEMYSTHN